MAGKLIITWDILPEREQEYFEFVVREFLPAVQKLGFKLSDAWVTVYGDYPQILVGAVLPTITRVAETIKSQKWKSLENKLFDYISDYELKIVEARSSFQF